jgi:hypothetical protein
MKRAVHRALIVYVLTTFGCGGCSSHTPLIPIMDDGGNDAGEDAGIDAGYDAGPSCLVGEVGIPCRGGVCVDGGCMSGCWIDGGFVAPFNPDAGGLGLRQPCVGCQPSVDPLGVTNLPEGLECGLHGLACRYASTTSLICLCSLPGSQCPIPYTHDAGTFTACCYGSCNSDKVCCISETYPGTCEADDYCCNGGKCCDKNDAGIGSCWWDAGC